VLQASERYLWSCHAWCRWAQHGDYYNSTLLKTVRWLYHTPGLG
jgi:hypothetical protein